METTFLSVLSIALFRDFSEVETIIEIRGKSTFKDEPYFCWWTRIFFQFFQRIFQVEVAFP